MKDHGPGFEPGTSRIKKTRLLTFRVRIIVMPLLCKKVTELLGGKRVIGNTCFTLSRDKGVTIAGGVGSKTNCVIHCLLAP